MNRPHAHEAGLSLVEVLVVLAIIGAMSGAALLSVSRDRAGEDAEAEARRLAARLQFAADEALLTGIARRLDWDETSYRILAWDPERGAWRLEPLALLSEPHGLADGLTLAGPDGLRSVLIAPDAGSRGDFVVRNSAETWAVRFDGLTAQATPGAHR